jgi:hypothetical protein
LLFTDSEKDEATAREQRANLNRRATPANNTEEVEEEEVAAETEEDAQVEEAEEEYTYVEVEEEDVLEEVNKMDILEMLKTAGVKLRFIDNLSVPNPHERNGVEILSITYLTNFDLYDPEKPRLSFILLGSRMDCLPS